MNDKEYLGDGVYVEHDGYQLWLTTEGSDGANRIALEPGVYSALVAYVERLRRQVAAAGEAAP